MQPTKEIVSDDPSNHHHQYLQYMDGNSYCSSMLDHSQGQNLYLHPPLFQQQSLPNTHLLFEQQHQFHPFQHEKDVQQQQQLRSYDDFFNVNFTLDLNDNSIFNNERGLSVCEPQTHSSGIPNCQEQEDSGSKFPLWKGLNMDHEALYSRGRIGEDKQMGYVGDVSAMIVENSQENGILPLMPPSDTYSQNFINSAPLGALEEFKVSENASTRRVGKRKKEREVGILEEEELSSLAVFFERLMKRAVDHQECLQKEFLEAIERMYKERWKREEEWRRLETEKHNREAIARANEQALASCRESTIVSYIEKITGQTINLPSGKIPLVFIQPEEKTKELTHGENGRWAKAEVEALIQIRSSLGLKFHEPGLRGPCWEEISSLMDSMGYNRSAKRCKEKWENINKYFKRNREIGKIDTRNNCSYFDQLKEFHSRMLMKSKPLMEEIKDGRDLEVELSQNPSSGCPSTSEMESQNPDSIRTREGNPNYTVDDDDEILKI